MPRRKNTPVDCNPPAEAFGEVAISFPEDDPNWHPQWDAALSALMGYQRQGVGWQWTGNYDAKPMADALMTNLPIPSEVRRYIATLLVPHAGWLGPKARIDRRPKKSIRLAMEGLAKKRTIRNEYSDGLARGEKSHYLEALLAEKYRVRRTFIRDAINLTDSDLVALSCQILGARITGLI